MHENVNDYTIVLYMSMAKSVYIHKRYIHNITWQTNMVECSTQLKECFFIGSMCLILCMVTIMHKLYSQFILLC